MFEDQVKRTCDGCGYWEVRRRPSAREEKRGGRSVLVTKREAGPRGALLHTDEPAWLNVDASVTLEGDGTNMLTRREGLACSPPCAARVLRLAALELEGDVEALGAFAAAHSIAASSAAAGAGGVRAVAESLEKPVDVGLVERVGPAYAYAFTAPAARDYVPLVRETSEAGLAFEGAVDAIEPSNACPETARKVVEALRAGARVLRALNSRVRALEAVAHMPAVRASDAAVAIPTLVRDHGDAAAALARNRLALAFGFAKAGEALELVTHEDLYRAIRNECHSESAGVRIPLSTRLARVADLFLSRSAGPLDDDDDRINKAAIAAAAALDDKDGDAS